jgi:hypothetical protein
MELVPAVRMVALRYRGLVTDRVPQPAIAEHASDAPLDAAKNIVALYDREKKIIYLQEGSGKIGEDLVKALKAEARRSRVAGTLNTSVPVASPPLRLRRKPALPL